MIDPSPDPTTRNPSPRRCTAHTKRGPCKAAPIKGGTVCVAHGGRAPQVKAAARRRHARHLAEQDWATYGGPVDTDPASAVLDQLSWTAGHVAWLRDRVHATDPDALVWGKTKETEKTVGEYPGVDTVSEAKASIWLTLYAEERDRLVRIADIAHRMGIEDRRVALAERLGAGMASAMQNILTDLDLTGQQWERAAQAVPARLRELLAMAST